MPDDRSHALTLYMFAAVAGLSFFAAVYFIAWAYRSRTIGFPTQ